MKVTLIAIGAVSLLALLVFLLRTPDRVAWAHDCAQAQALMHGSVGYHARSRREPHTRPQCDDSIYPSVSQFQLAQSIGNPYHYC